MKLKYERRIERIKHCLLEGLTLTTYIPSTNLKIQLSVDTLTTASKEIYARHVVTQLMA